ncbi:BCD family MFS transporter [Granulosicoccus sp.]|nr:BCD family MFS transporter [Granulosicoccus sp.]
MNAQTIGWFGVLRLGLVQTSLGAIVVLTTSTINRIMVVELALPALLPGLLVGLHYAIQITRPRMGYGSDTGGKRTPWIIGGMLVLGLGGFLAALSTSLISGSPVVGIALAVFAFLLVGLGVGAAGTSLLVLLAKSVAPRYRGAAASTVWVMMIIGFIVTAVVAGKQLDPFSFDRLLVVTGSVSLIAFIVTCIAVAGVEAKVLSAPKQQDAEAVAAHDEKSARQAEIAEAGFSASIKAVWAEPDSRRFSVFVFISMLAYSAQDLILEPFAGSVFGMTPGESTQLSGAQHGGVLSGMLLVALLTSVVGGRYLGSLRRWTIVGCIASAIALFSLAAGGFMSSSFPLRAVVFALGLANGVFAVAAIGSMMDLVGRGGSQREGVRMGLWGAAQAIAFGLGGIGATFAVDLSRVALGDMSSAYAIVFVLQGLLFFWAARLAAGVYQPAQAETVGQFSAGRIALEMDQ